MLEDILLVILMIGSAVFGLTLFISLIAMVVFNLAALRNLRRESTIGQKSRAVFTIPFGGFFLRDHEEEFNEKGQKQLRKLFFFSRIFVWSMIATIPLLVIYFVLLKITG